MAKEITVEAVDPDGASVEPETLYSDNVGKRKSYLRVSDYSVVWIDLGALPESATQLKVTVL